MDGQVLEMVEGGIARPEIVNGHLDAQVSQLLQYLDRKVHVLHQDGFSDFELDQFGADVVLVQARLDFLDELRM